MQRRWGLAALVTALWFAESDGSDSDSGSSSSSDGDSSDSGDLLVGSYVSDSSSSSDGNDNQTTGRKRRAGEPGVTSDISSSDLGHLRYGDPDASDDNDSGDSGSDGGGDGGDGGGGE